MNTRGRPGELPPNSSDEEEEEEESESEDDSDDELLNPHRRAPRPKAVEPVVEKSKKELEADMEKLRLVRERRAQQAAERIARGGGGGGGEGGVRQVRAARIRERASPPKVLNRRERNPEPDRFDATLGA